MKEIHILLFSKKQPKNKKKFCPSCEDYTDYRKDKRKEIYTVEGKVIEIDVERRICSVCGECFTSDKEEDKILKRIYAISNAAKKSDK